MRSLTTRAALLAISTSAATALLGAGAVAANADANGTVTATVTVAPPPLRSISVSPASISFGGCASNTGAPSPAGLALPNGTCHTPDGTGTDQPISITNGAVTSTIDVAGGDAVPSDNAQHWTLCGTNAACTAVGQPGADQYKLEVKAVGNTAEQPPLSTTSACDNMFRQSATPPSAGCLAQPGQVSHEWLRLTGPSASTDAASTFATAVTWTATP